MKQAAHKSNQAQIEHMPTLFPSNYCIKYEQTDSMWQCFGIIYIPLKCYTGKRQVDSGCDTRYIVVGLLVSEWLHVYYCLIIVVTLSQLSQISFHQVIPYPFRSLLCHYKCPVTPEWRPYSVPTASKICYLFICIAFFIFWSTHICV